MQALRESGHQVHAVSMEDGSTAKIREAGFPFHPLNIQGKGANPLADLQLVQQYKKIFEEVKPDVVLNFTIKPVIYSTIAAKGLGIPVINNIAGLGTLFNQTTWVTRIAILLYRYSQKNVEHIFFQNEDDVELFKRLQILKKQSYSRLPGSGVDVGRFVQQEKRTKSKEEGQEGEWDHGAKRKEEGREMEKGELENGEWRMENGLDPTSNKSNTTDFSIGEVASHQLSANSQQPTTNSSAVALAQVENPASPAGRQKLIQPPELQRRRQTNFLLFGRMLWDKGVGEYIEAARAIKKENLNANFWVLGLLDFQNLTAIKSEDMQQWIDEGIIDYLGKTDRVEKYIREADCIVYPSYYREGVPRSLLETAAMGKPIITTENVGCKEVVENGYNGYKIPVKNSQALTQAMQQFIGLSEKEKNQLGQNSRKLAEEKFDEKFVIEAYLKQIERVTAK